MTHFVDFYIKFTLRQWTGRVERAHIIFSHDDWGEAVCWGAKEAGSLARPCLNPPSVIKLGQARGKPAYSRVAGYAYYNLHAWVPFNGSGNCITTKAQIPRGSSRHVSTRHVRRVETMHFGCVELLDMLDTTRSTRSTHARVVSCRGVT